MMNAGGYIYFDHNATTPVAPEVVEAMAKALREEFGNPNSIHKPGASARYRMEKVRRQLAKFLNAKPDEIVFTSCGSESDNLAVRGAAFAARRNGKGDHLIISAIEHRAVLETAVELRDFHGFKLTILPVDSDGRVRPDDLRRALRADTVLVSIMYANNEIGSVNRIAELVAVTREGSNALFHTDAIQAVGRLPIDVRAEGVDLLSLSGHKLYGPKGVGALYVREGVELERQMSGGGQEKHRRSGTENVPGIIGLGVAVELAAKHLEGERERLTALRELLWSLIHEACPEVIRNSPRDGCLPGTLNVSFLGADSQKLITALDMNGAGCSSGSACSSAGTRHSHVVVALAGEDGERAAGAIRISLGRSSTEEEVRRFAQIVPKAIPLACAGAMA